MGSDVMVLVIEMYFCVLQLGCTVALSVLYSALKPEYVLQLRTTHLNVWYHPFGKTSTKSNLTRRWVSLDRLSYVVIFPQPSSWFMDGNQERMQLQYKTSVQVRNGAARRSIQCFRNASRIFHHYAHSSWLGFCSSTNTISKKANGLKSISCTPVVLQAHRCLFWKTEEQMIDHTC